MMFSATIDQLLLAYTCEFLLPNYFRVRVGELNTTALTVKQHFIKVVPSSFNLDIQFKLGFIHLFL